jgi:dihydroorotase
MPVSKLPKFKVVVEHITVETYEVFAEDEDAAVEKVEDGEATLVNTYHDDNDSTDVELLEEGE